MSATRPSTRRRNLALPAFLAAVILFLSVGQAAGLTGNQAAVVTGNTALLKPSRPNGLTATAQTTTAQLSWKAGSGWVTSYYLYLNGKHVASQAARVHSYTFSGLSPSTKYTLGVAAHNIRGTSSIAWKTVVTSALSSPTGSPFGVGFYNLSTEQSIDRAKQVNAIYFRNTAFLLSPGAYQHDPSVIRASGLQQILNIHYATAPAYGPPGPSSYPADLNDYKARVARAIDDVRPVLLVVENEASYEGHWTGTPEQYGQMLAAAVEVGHAKNVPVATDGTISRTVVKWVYSGLVNEGRSAEAEDFWGRAAEPGQQKPNASDSGNPWFAAYQAGNPDYINIHFYWSEPISLLTARDYLSRALARPVITSEWGIRSEDPALMTKLMDVLATLDFAQLWSHDTSEGTRSLFDPNGNLRPIGEAFRDYIAQHYSG